MSTHTPGPWSYADDVGIVYGPKHQKVVLAHVGASLSDMALIAAAPDLLKVLKSILEHPRTDDRSIVFAPREVAAARAAIAKATGEA